MSLCPGTHPRGGSHRLRRAPGPRGFRCSGGGGRGRGARGRAGGRGTREFGDPVAHTVTVAVSTAIAVPPIAIKAMAIAATENLFILPPSCPGSCPDGRYCTANKTGARQPCTRRFPRRQNADRRAPRIPENVPFLLSEAFFIGMEIF